MSWSVEVESITGMGSGGREFNGRDLTLTRIFLRDVNAETPTYWEVEVQTEPHRAWYEVRRDGWHVATLQARDYIEGWEVRWVGPIREAIPPQVISHLPEVTS